jgi:hypothetical protein
MMADQDEQTYERLKANPAPNFTALIARYGSYEAIPPQAWTAFADAQLEWERRRRARSRRGWAVRVVLASRRARSVPLCRLVGIASLVSFCSLVLRVPMVAIVVPILRILPR